METIDEKIKLSKQKLGEKIPCSIEVLTPVHVGSGVKLAEGIDFDKTDSSVRIISQADLMKYLEDNPDKLNEFIKSGYKISVFKKLPFERSFQIDTKGLREILEFERNGNGKPYIPGSSLKGSIRTAILYNLFSTLPVEAKDKLLKEAKDYKKGENWASEPILNEIFGADSNYNLMRALQVFDANFSTEIDLHSLHLLSLNGESAYGWKKMGKDKKTNKPFPLQDNPKYSTFIFVEALPIDTIGYFSISINDFLINNPIASAELKFKENAILAIKNFITTINSYSKQKLEKEKEFFEKLTSPKILTKVIDEIDNLLDKINNLSNDEFILRISWGSGWKGMTGDFLDDNWLKIFRQKYRLGKTGFDIFPKTRRIVFEDNKPKYLTGFVKIKLNDSKKTNLKEINTEQNDKIDSNDWAAVLGKNFTVKETKKK